MQKGNNRHAEVHHPPRSSPMSQYASKLPVGNAHIFVRRAILSSTIVPSSVRISPRRTKLTLNDFGFNRVTYTPLSRKEFVMKILRVALPMVATLALSLSLAPAGWAQNRSQAAARPDLMSTLLELDRTAAATNSDISHLQIEKWKGGWRTGFTTSSAHKNQAAQNAQSLQRNLKGALPDLIRDAMNSRGGMYATFKVYEDVSLVCEAMDTLANNAHEYGKQEEYGPLATDYNSLIRLRRVLSSYIQQKAAAADGGVSYSSFTSAVSTDGLGMPKKIIIDDGVPDKPKKSVAAAKKKKPSGMQFSNNQ
jgi:hypothetical protein